MLKSVLKAFNQKPIAVYPIYIRITGDPHSAMALSQILYWHDIAGGEFYKTDEELAVEICATPKQIERIKRVLHGLNFLKITLRQVPAKTFYDVDLELLGVEIHKFMQSTSFHQKGESSLHQKGESSFHQKGESSHPQKGESSHPQKGECNTKNTYIDYTETTTEINYGDKRKKSSGDKSKKSVDKFVKPTADQVWQYLCEINATHIDPQAFVDYYEARGWLLGKQQTPMKDWQAAVRTWVRNNFGGNNVNATTGNTTTGERRKLSPSEQVAAECGYSFSS